MKPVFLTFAYGNDMYHKFANMLINRFKDRGYDTYICTKNVHQLVSTPCPYKILDLCALIFPTTRTSDDIITIKVFA